MESPKSVGRAPLGALRHPLSTGVCPGAGLGFLGSPRDPTERPRERLGSDAGSHRLWPSARQAGAGTPPEEGAAGGQGPRLTFTATCSGAGHVRPCIYHLRQSPAIATQTVWPPKIFTIWPFPERPADLYQGRRWPAAACTWAGAGAEAELWTEPQDTQPARPRKGEPVPRFSGEPGGDGQSQPWT